MTRFCSACIELQPNQQAHYDGCFSDIPHPEDIAYPGEIIPMAYGWGAWNDVANKQVRVILATRKSVGPGEIGRQLASRTADGLRY